PGSVRQGRSGRRSRFGLLLPATPDSPHDPTLAGALLEIENPTSAEATTIALPASGWRFSRRKKPGQHGWRYADPAKALGPCRSVQVLRAERVTIRCVG